MSYADAQLPSDHVDAKRIAATSGVIALHAAIFMMLLMPATTPSAPAEEETDIQITIPEKLVIPPKPPEPKPKPPEIVRERPPVVVPFHEEVMAQVDDAPSALDTQFEEDLRPPTTVEIDPPQPASSFAQLAVAVGPAPPYPRAAVRGNIQGTVVLRIHVDASGKPSEVIVEQSSGSRILDEAAAAFVKKRWSFVPAQRDGQAVDAWGLLPIEFTLN